MDGRRGRCTRPRTAKSGELAETKPEQLMVNQFCYSCMKKTIVFVLFFIATVAWAQDRFELINPSFEINDPEAGMPPSGWIDLGLKTETPPDRQPGRFEVMLPAQDGALYIGLVVRENKSWEGLGQKLKGSLKKDSVYTFSVYLTRSQKYMSATRTSTAFINFNAPTILKIWGYNTVTKQDELLAESSAVSHSEWTKYSFTLMPTVADFDELDLMAYYAPGFENKNGNLLMDNCSAIVRVKK